MDKPDNSIFRTLLKVRTHLPRKYKWQLKMFFAGSVAMSLLESMALGLVAIFVTAVAKPEALMVKANAFFHTSYWDSAMKVVVALGLAVVLAFVVKNSLRRYSSYGQHAFPPTWPGITACLSSTASCACRMNGFWTRIRPTSSRPWAGAAP